MGWPGVWVGGEGGRRGEGGPTLRLGRVIADPPVTATSL